MGDKKSTAKVEPSLLEEDDEFEEFPANDSETKVKEETAGDAWANEWEDDKNEEDFASQLKVQGTGLKRNTSR